MFALKKQTNTIKIHILIFVTCAVVHLIDSGCRQQVENEVLDVAKFAEVYADLVVLTTLDTTSSLDSTVSDSLYWLETALNKHNVSQELYEKSIKYFQSQPKLWVQVFSKVAENLNEIKNQDKRKKQDESNGQSSTHLN
ncbi:MAG: DUF4296 domain-containing protein [bacterium]